MKTERGTGRGRARIAAAALAATGAAAWCQGAEPTADGGLEPEKDDVVLGSLAEQERMLGRVVEIMGQLEAVASQEEAAKELLSEEGEPIDRLRRALEMVAGDGMRTQSQVVPVVEAAPAAEAAPESEEPREEVRVDVVYAQVGEGSGRAVVAVGGGHYAVTAGRPVRIGENVVEVVAVRAGAGGRLEVEVRVNGGAPFTRRPGG